jgi:phosphoglycolate phosphatase-like HAD superfamily hydrolase
MIYLVSATPQQELNDIIEARGLKKFFKNVYGAPIDKVEVLLRIMTNEKISANEILYIGDSPEDQKAARILGIKFIGRQSDRVLNSDLNNIYLDFFKIKDHLLKVYSLT